MDLEKAYDRVTREVVWWALRYMGVDNGLVQMIQSMYNDPKSATKFKEGSAQFFEVRLVCTRAQLLSIIVLEAITGRFRSGLLLDLLYADDLALVAESNKELHEKFKFGGLDWRQRV